MAAPDIRRVPNPHHDEHGGRHRGPTPWALPILEQRVDQQPVSAGELVDVLLAIGWVDEGWHAGLAHRTWLGDQQCSTWATMDRFNPHVPAVTRYAARPAVLVRTAQPAGSSAPSRAITSPAEG